MKEIALESLIQEHRGRIGQLRYTPPSECWGLSYYYYDDPDDYQRWLATTKRFIGVNYQNDKDVNEFESISKEELGPEQQKRLLAILEAFAVLPTIIPNNSTQTVKNKGQGKDAINVVTTINNTNSQSQSQEQSLAMEIFIEAIKDDLTGRQIKELKTVVAEADNDLQKARPRIIEKLKSFGADVASNIVANLLTNPVIWGGL